MNLLRIPFFMALAVLAACNSGEDFSEGTTVTGGLITAEPTDPLDPLQEAVEIELLAAVQTPSGMRSARVTNIGYTCGEVDFYVPVAEPGAPGNSAGLPQHVARCPLDATSVRFFIGRRPADLGRRFYIGTARIPRCSARETAECSNSPGFYQFAVSDLIQSPAREASVALSASTRVAMLSVLDSINALDTGTGADDLLLEIPNEAHDITSGQFDSLVPTSASDGSYDAGVYAAYNDFTAAFGGGGWDDWRDTIQTAVQDAIDNDGADYSPLPGWPLEADSQEGAVLAGGRAKAGLYQFVHNSPGVLEYQLSFPDNIQYQRMSMVITYAVMPSGTVVGVGPLTAIPLTAGGELDTANVLNDLAVLGGGSTNDDEGFFGGSGGGISLRTYFEYDTDPTDLTISGRLLGPVMYDGLEVAQTDGGEPRVDFSEDYPIPDSDTESYDLLDGSNDDGKGRITGVLLGDSSQPFQDDEGNGLGVRSARTASVSPSLDADIVAALPQFYKLTFWKACVSDSLESPPIETSDCFTIPANETFVDDNGNTQYSNYPALLEGGSSFPDGFEVTKEQRRQFAPSDNGEVNLQILSDGRIVTDRDADCTAVDEGSLIDGADGDGAIEEYEVGFVTRTVEDEATGNRSAIALIYLVGDADLGDSGVVGYLPQFGTLVQGRLDLGTSGTPNTDAPLYRLGDENFADEIRAGWVDQFQSIEFQREAFDPNKSPGEQDAILQREFLALSGGAVQGQAQVPDGGACQNTP